MKPHRIFATVLSAFIAATAPQMADCTVLAGVKKGNTVWVGANSNTSEELPNGKFKRGPADCKIHPIGTTVMLHAGAISFPSNGRMINFIDLIEKATNPSLLLPENKARITTAIESEYAQIGKFIAAQRQAKGQKLPDRWIAIEAQTVVLVSVLATSGPRVIAFVITMQMEKETPKFILTDVDLTKHRDFSLMMDGREFPPVPHEWLNDNEDPPTWIREQINEKSQEDEADWGGQIVFARLSTGKEGSKWLQNSSPCQ